ncbi:MAG: helix-turn-helix domain-containing protein [Deltaproteobacteria bacterium]|nr:helix-turn-helix domain-containing protein [Deltaproteobacteria bacterium]
MPRKAPPQTPLYVRLPKTEGDKLDRAAAALGVHKKDLVAGLVNRYVDPDSQHGLSALGTLATRRPLDTSDRVTVGSYSFQSYDPPEIMNAEQAGQFLQLEENNVIELAEAGKLPGKKLGPVWRFSRDALVAWLATPNTERR